MMISRDTLAAVSKINPAFLRPVNLFFHKSSPRVCAFRRLGLTIRLLYLLHTRFLTIYSIRTCRKQF